jgi:predicted CxxxxCH...CXXCH cytochrome family protein
MKKLSRMEFVTRPLIATLLSLSLVLLLASGAQAAVNCATCHGIVDVDGITGIDAHPVDTPPGSLPTYRNITTGAVKGNHNTHSGPSMNANVCTKCHGAAVATYTTKHAVLKHYSIQIAPTVNYNKGVGAVTAFPQTDTPVLGNCSNVACHFNTPTPQWGSNPLGTASLNNTCGTCHNALPTTGSHDVHLAAVGNTLNGCARCHTDHGAAAKPYQHATSASRPIAVTLSFGYAGSDNNFLVSTGRVYGSCATANCHDDGLGNGALSLIDTPVWGDASAGKCTVCHPSRPGSGSHLEHLSGPNVACASCHNGAVESLTVPTLHTNNVVDVYKTTAGDLGYPAGKAKGSAYVTCNTASCHVDPSTVTLGVAQQKISPVWGDTTQIKCAYCHAAAPTTGGHTAHFNAGFTACANCHNGAVLGTTLSASHNNNVIDVYKTTPGDMGYPQAKAAGSAAGSCSTTSCHDDGRGVAVPSPAWGVTNSDCSACHANLPNTGSHVQHMGGIGITCGNCHKGAVQGTTAPTLHMNNTIEAYKTTVGDFGYGAVPNKPKNTPFASCTTVNCHGRLSPVWGANTPNYQCTKCHGKGILFANYSTVTSAQAAPGYDGVGLGVGRQTGIVTSYVSSDPKVGAHDTHLHSSNNMGHPADCVNCHTVPATAFVAGHMDGSSLPIWSNLVQNKETTPGSAIPYTYAKGAVVPAYDSLTGACSNTYCHGATLPGGTDKAPKWNDGSYLTGTRATDCAKCHGYPPETSTKLAHTPIADYMTCSGCHPHNGTRESTDPLLGNDFHINGKLEASKFCDTCHDYDTRGATGNLWGKNQMGIESYGAHAMHINYLKGRMNVTTMDANIDGFGSVNYNGICGVCHTRNQASHLQGNRTTSLRDITFGEVLDRQFGQLAPKYNGVTNTSSSQNPKTCSNTDCHYKTSPIWQSY